MVVSGKQLVDVIVDPRDAYHEIVRSILRCHDIPLHPRYEFFKDSEKLGVYDVISKDDADGEGELWWGSLGTSIREDDIFVKKVLPGQLEIVAKLTSTKKILISSIP